jgi:hypothetical protein
LTLDFRYLRCTSSFHLQFGFSEDSKDEFWVEILPSKTRRAGCVQPISDLAAVEPFRLKTQHAPDEQVMGVIHPDQGQCLGPYLDLNFQER